MLRGLVATWLTVGGIAVAHAEDPLGGDEPEEPAEPLDPEEPDDLPEGGEYSSGKMELDVVLVGMMRAADPALAGKAEALRGEVERAFADRFVVTELKDVPAFDNYGAETYLRACPPAEDLGCAWVVGNRGGASWVVAGTVVAGEEDDQALEVTVTFVNVAESRSSLTFSAVVGEDEHTAFATGVGDVLQKIIDGAAKLVDAREDEEDPAIRRQREAEENALAAEALAELDAELGALLRSTRSDVEATRLTKEDLEAFVLRDDAKPWERHGWSRSQYLRYKNWQRRSDSHTILSWRAMLRGRQGLVLLRLGAGYGVGPYFGYFDGRYAQDAQTLDPVEVVTLQELRTGPTFHGEIEAGYGILPWLDVDASFAWRYGRYAYLIHKEVVGNPKPADDPELVRRNTWQIGGDAHFVPLPSFPIRPAASAGVAYWDGTRIDRVVDATSIDPIPPAKAPWALLVRASVGLEATLATRLTFYARVMGTVPVAGRMKVETQEGVAALANRPSAQGHSPVGIDGGGGFLLRFGRLNTTVKRSKSNDDDDGLDEELD